MPRRHLKHHFVDRDGVLARMLPHRRTEGTRKMIRLLRAHRCCRSACCCWRRTPAAAQGVLVDKSDIRFVSKQMGVNVEGRFRKWKANVVFLPAALDKSKADVRHRARERRPRERRVGRRSSRAPHGSIRPNFPVAHFASTSIKDLGGGKYEIAGRALDQGLCARPCVVPVTLRTDAAGNRVAEGKFSAEASRLPGRRGAVGRHRHRRQRRHRLGPDRAAARLKVRGILRRPRRVCFRGRSSAPCCDRVADNQKRNREDTS